MAAKANRSSGGSSRQENAASIGTVPWQIGMHRFAAGGAASQMAGGTKRIIDDSS